MTIMARRKPDANTPEAPVTHDTESPPTHTTTEKIQPKPRHYVVSGPDGVQVIKAFTPASISKHLLATLGYSIDTPDKEYLVELLTSGVEIIDVTTDTAATA